MKYKGSIMVNQSRARVVEAFMDEAAMKKYQDGFQKKELLSGTKGTDGAKSRMYYQHGKREMILEETIVANRLPETFEAFYHHEQMDNTMKCTFVEVDNGQTRYEYEFEYTRMNWVIPRLIAILFPSVYRKQAEKWMKQFKELLENEE